MTGILAEVMKDPSPTSRCDDAAPCPMGGTTDGPTAVRTAVVGEAVKPYVDDALGPGQ